MNLKKQCNILLVDDNEIAANSCIKALQEKIPLGEKFIITHNVTKWISKDGIDKLIHYKPIASQRFNETIEDVKNLIVENHLNVLWLDKGYYDIKINEGKLLADKKFGDAISETNGESGLLGEILKLENKNFLQIIVFSYNPILKDDEIFKLEKEFKGLRFFELSSLFLLYNKDETITDGTLKNAFGQTILGDSLAFEKYGYLQGYFLSFLYNELKPRIGFSLSKSPSRYSNYQFLRFIKLFNEEILGNKSIENGFKVATITFTTQSAFFEEEFPVDIPYREYYDELDKKIGAEKLLEIFEDDENNEGVIHHIYYKYYSKKINGTVFLRKYEDNINSGFSDKHLRYLEILHPAIFYEPKEKIFKAESITEQAPVEDKIQLVYYWKKINNKNYKGILGISVVTRFDKTQKEIEEDIDNFKACFFQLIENRAIVELIPLLLKTIKKSSTRAAISQVMARNMSHNIGSHVLASLVKQDQFAKVHSQAFLRYLQTRMEFIADISTSESVITFPSALKRDVIEKFLPPVVDLKRLNEWSLYLIKYISGSNQISFNIDTPNTSNIQINLDLEDDLVVSLPNDILGAQSFYVILENIIRNSIKHSIIPEVEIDGRSIKKLILTIKHEKDFANDDLIKITINDNLGDANKELRANEDYSYTEIKNKNIKCDFLAWMNSKINRKILLGSKLRQNDWGLLEIKICAAYLRKHSLFDIDEFSEPALLKFCLDDKKNAVFEIYLLKPKYALVITKEKIEGINENKLKNYGIDIKTIEELDLQYLLRFGFANKIKSNNLQSHEYLILERDILSNKNSMDLKVDSNQSFITIEKDAIEQLLKQETLVNIRYGIMDLLFQAKQKKDIVLVDQNSNSYEQLNDKLVFDDHGGYRKKINSVSKLEPFYYEPYGSQSPTNIFLDKYNTLKDEVKEILNYEFNLAAEMKVGVLDERIQDDGEKKDSNLSDLKVREILDGMNICMPRVDEFNLYANNYHEKNGHDETIAQKIDSWLSNNITLCDYLVIHQGVIEKTLNSTDPDRIKIFINKFEKGTARIIIISGRGKPSNLPEEVFYLPFSLVNQYVIVYRSKLYLWKLLKSVRRYRHD